MPRRPHAPGCLLAVLSLVAPCVAHAEPVPDDAVAAPIQPEGSQAPAGDAPDVDPDAAEVTDVADTADAASTEAEANANRAAPTPEPADAEPLDDGDVQPAENIDDDADIDDSDVDDSDVDDDADIDDDADVDDADIAPVSPLPDRLPRLQRIGWYNVIGAFTLGTTAGLLAGLAERQEDKATRIASGYNLETGGSLLYADRQEAYETSLDRGQALETSAIVVGALAGATAIAAITLFAVDAKRRGPSATARRTRIGPGSLEVSF